MTSVSLRSMSLIKVDVNIGTKAISKGMDKVLLQIIHHNQNAHVKGRTIFDAVRTIDDVISFMALKNISSLMIVIDFDSVN